MALAAPWPDVESFTVAGTTRSGPATFLVALALALRWPVGIFPHKAATIRSYQ